MNRPRGITRVRRPDPMEDDVETTDGSISMEVPETLYQERGYEPPLESLPWRGIEGVINLPPEPVQLHRIPRQELLAYIWRMPGELRVTSEAATAERAKGNTLSMRQGSAMLLDVLRGFWIDLAEQVEPEALDGRSPAEAFDQIVDPRRDFYYGLMKSREGTIWPQIAQSYLIGDVHKLIELFVADFLGLGDDARGFGRWRAEWRGAVGQAAYPWIRDGDAPNIG